MRIFSPACWRGGAEAAMWFIAATRRRGPAGGTDNPAGGLWRTPASVARVGYRTTQLRPSYPPPNRHKPSSSVQNNEPLLYSRVPRPTPPPSHERATAPAKRKEQAGEKGCEVR